MARSEHLPIYRASYDLCLYIKQLVQKFSRYHKYAIGAEVRETARRVLTLVVRANSRRDKRGVLLTLREEIETLTVLLRLAHDVHALPSFTAFEHAMRLATDVARQNEGWLKSQQQGRGASSSRLRPINGERQSSVQVSQMVATRRSAAGSLLSAT